MKKLTAWLLILTCLWGAAGALAEQPRGGKDLPYARIMEMTALMKALATGDYLEIKQVPATLRQTAQTWAAGIDGAPRLVVQLNTEDLAYLKETLAYFSQEPAIVAFEAHSTAISEVWQQLAYNASGESGLNEAGLEEIMAVNSSLNAQKIYADQGPSGDGMYIVLYDNAAPILLMVNCENGGVSIQGAFLPSARLAKCSNYGQVALWLMLNGFSMTCREILPE